MSKLFSTPKTVFARSAYVNHREFPNSRRKNEILSAIEYNIGQLSKVVQVHASSFEGRYPSEGHSYTCIGDVDCGTDNNQRDGWLYDILPYIEQQTRV